MRLMTKKVLILALGILVSFSVFGCNKGTKTTTTTTNPVFDGVIPQLSNSDDIFYDGGAYKITYGDIYEEFKINDGINRLLFMIDSSLLASYIANVTSDEIAEKTKFLTFGTSDDDEIAALDPDVKADFEAAYAENMNLLGYLDNQEVYVRMVCAKENYVLDQMYDSENSDSSWYVGPNTIASYYQDDYYEDYAAIKIRFYGETDAKNVLKAFNLVSLNGTLKLYTGTKPLDQVLPTSLNDTNTRDLSDDEIIDYFIQMYNYVYSYKTPLSTEATYEELIANEELFINIDTISANSANLATFIFDTLGSYNIYSSGESTKQYYTYTPVRYNGSNDTAYYMILNLNRPTKEDVSNFDGDQADLEDIIGAEMYQTIEDILVEKNLKTSGFISNRMTELRAANELVIYDYYLGIDYQSVDATYESNLEGNPSIVASFGGNNITADDLFTYAMGVNGGLYTLYAAQMAVAMNSYFSEAYCDEGTECDYNIETNTSTKMEEQRQALKDLQTSFESSYYVYYYTFDEYIYLAYGAKSHDDMLEKYYVKSTLQPYLVYDEIQKNDWELLTDYLYDLVEDYYDNYFSLNVDHLLIYVDRDEDGSQDIYQDFVASLDDQVAYHQILSDFETAIRSYLNASADNTFSTLVNEYVKAKRSDETWGIYKNYGFYLMTEDLSSEESLTYLSTVNQFESSFVDGLIATYAQYNEEENLDADAIYYDSNVETSYGVHLIYATKGSNFERPSAAFEMTYDGATPNYTEGIQNDSDMLSIDQLKLYVTYRFYEIVYGTGDDAEETYGFSYPVIPTSVMDALEAYFADLNDSMYVVGFLNVIVSNQLQEGSFTNEHPAYCSDTEAELKARIAEVGDIYFEQLFSSYDTVSE